MAARIVDALSHPSQRGKLDGKREDDTASRWLVQKRTYFKGNYDRVLTISPTAIGTQMPNLQGTNLYSLTPDFSVKSVTFEKDCLTVNARPDTKVCERPAYSGAHYALLTETAVVDQDTVRTEKRREMDSSHKPSSRVGIVIVRGVPGERSAGEAVQGHSNTVSFPATRVSPAALLPAWAPDPVSLAELSRRRFQPTS